MKKGWKDLSRLKKLNIICNKEAKKLINAKTRTLIVFSFYLSSFYITINTLVLNSTSQINKHIVKKKSAEYYCKKINLKSIDDIN